MPGPIFLEGKTVSLRTIEEEDLTFLKRGVNDPSIWRTIGRPLPANDVQEQEFFENVVSTDETVTLLITSDEEPIGTVGFNEMNHEIGSAEIGYWIAPEYHNQGYGSEAVELLVEYGFNERNLHRIEARVFEFNTASKRLLESVGFTEEGVHRDAHFARGQYQDTHWFGLLEHEWRQTEDTQ